MNECNIVRDLFPNYIDELCSEDSKRMVENHVQQCEECSQRLSGMQGGEWEEKIDSGETSTQKSKEKQEVEENCEKETELALFRVMKKVVWHRVVMMFFSVIAAIFAIGFLVVVVLAQFHPEWDMEAINIRQIQMRNLAKEKTKDFAEGNIEGFLEGYKNALLNNYHHTNDNEKVIRLVAEKIQNIQEEKINGKEYSVKIADTGWAGFADSKPMYLVVVLLECEEYNVLFNYCFIEDEIYVVGCDVEEREEASIELVASLGWWCEYLSQDMYSTVDLHQDTLINLKLSELAQEKTEAEKKEHCEMRAALTFTKDCTGPKYGYRLLDGEYPDYLKQWGSRIYDFQKNHTLKDIWVQNEGVDMNVKKELRTILWKFTDSHGTEGIMEKKFYYGPGGYEPVDAKEKVYGDGLSEETIEQLEGIFD